MPKVTVVIPSYRGADRLRPTLSALASQTVKRKDFEVILVVDGGDRATIEAAESAVKTLNLRVYPTPHVGAGAARNIGAEQANADLLLFLDDDMAAEPRLLAAQLQAHRKRPGHVVLGRFVHSGTSDLVVSSNKAWWDTHFAELAKEEHRFTYKDLCSGCFSIAKDEFFAVGGFSADFKESSGEDYELGIRLLKSGVPFQFISTAQTTHNFKPTRAKALRRAYQEGRGDVTIVRKHPEIAPSLKLTWAVEDGPWIQFRKKSYRLRPLLTRFLPVFLTPVARVAQSLKLRGLWSKSFGLLHSCAYWRGVFDEIGSEKTFRAFAQDLVLSPKIQRELLLDIAVDLKQLGQLLAASKPDAVNLLYDGIAIGRIPPIAGAESLRDIHIRHALAKWFAYDLARVMTSVSSARVGRLEGTDH